MCPFAELFTVPGRHDDETRRCRSVTARASVPGFPTGERGFAGAAAVRTLMERRTNRPP